MHTLKPETATQDELIDEASEPVSVAADEPVHAVAEPMEHRSLFPCSWSEVLTVIGSVKTICEFEVYGNVSVLLLGAIEALRFRLNPWLLLPIFICVLQIGVYASPAGLHYLSVIRIVQFVLMVLFGQYVARSQMFDRVYAYWLAFFMLGFFLALEVVFVGPANVREVGFASFLPRFAGPRGDANFTALAFCGLAVLALSRGHLVTSLVGVAMSLPSLSRGATLGLAAALFASVLMRTRTGVTRWLMLAFLLAPFLYPLVPYYCDTYVSRGQFMELNEMSSNRLIFQVGYYRMGLDSPLYGHGFFQSQGQILQHLPYEFTWTRTELEQHSLYLQLWSDFGLIAYALFSVFAIYVCNTALRTRPMAAPGLAYIFYSMLFLNGLTDWTVWLLIGDALRGLYEPQPGIEADYHEDSEEFDVAESGA